MKKNIIYIVVSLLVVAGLGTLFTQLGMGWFDGLRKPIEWIPSWIIPIVWTVIYLLFAFVLIKWQSRRPISKENIILLIVNGILNILWCLVFFTLNQLFLGNVIIIINALFAIRLYLEICKDDAMNGFIISLYPIWLCIATTLNLALWILN
ncbi:MAG: tryptophan-rich sensory protein [Clostridia bacterium]|nr:tryptophan-rich sensory protein [Clostridia bacterium]MBQ8792506.1 tryptophan-rich sensory protein [Clostridia bacterium]